MKAEPFKACQTIENPDSLKGKIAFIERGECMFIDKVRVCDLRREGRGYVY